MLAVQQMTLLGVDDNHADAAVMHDCASDEWFIHDNPVLWIYRLRLRLIT